MSAVLRRIAAFIRDPFGLREIGPLMDEMGKSLDSQRTRHRWRDAGAGPLPVRFATEGAAGEWPADAPFPPAPYAPPAERAS